MSIERRQAKPVRLAFDVGIEQGAQRRFGLGAHNFLDHLAVPVEAHGGQAADVVLLRQLAFRFGVHLGKQEFPGVFIDEFDQHRHLHVAGSAPVGPEIDQYRHGVRRLDDL
jgi:hypothetical protein